MIQDFYADIEEAKQNLVRIQQKILWLDDEQKRKLDELLEEIKELKDSIDIR